MNEQVHTPEAAFDTAFCQHAALLSAALAAFIEFHEREERACNPEISISVGLKDMLEELTSSFSLPGQMEPLELAASACVAAYPECVAAYLEKIKSNA